jgi:hypothetical protein
MENKGNVDNKIGCQAGRTKIVDPNNFYGQNSDSNLSVPLEDLNISVILKTERKGRTVLTSSGDKSTTGTKESTTTMTINFIEGSTVAGKKVLTTNYTDLTVLASDSSNDEALGITSIDIDFNSSMAPMVNINFVDVRGSAIFQNENNISGNNTANKYSTFFQLPYPKFELEVKGYYGKPVTYCLHMLKFNSKFNSQTGNFEITCQFIGYTYAMLSDMLMGYLKAIPFTKEGKINHEKIESERGYEILNLVELMQRIQKINEGVKKIAGESPEADAYGSGVAALEDLTNIELTIKALGQYLDLNKEKTKYPFIVKEDKDLTDADKQEISNYQKQVSSYIKSFNEKNAGASLDENYFILFYVKNTDKGLYPSVSKDMFDPTKYDIIIDNELKETLGSPSDFNSLKERIFKTLSLDYKDIISGNKLLNIYNMNGLYNKIDVARTLVNKETKSKKESLAGLLKTTVAEKLGFEPTVRKLIEIFTTAIEVFMETIYKISTAAENPSNNPRTDQLKAKFGTDIVKTDIKQENLKELEFFAWPDYRERDDVTKTYVDKYLGEPGVLDRPQDVDELVFIDDLLNAFLTAQELINDVVQDMEEGETTWYPVNPIDTSIYIETEPYSRAELLTGTDVVRLMLIRGMTFLGYTNDSSTLDRSEIEKMALAEADAILRSVTNDTVKLAISNLALSDITKTQGVINGVSRDVVKKKTATIDGKANPITYYYYDYIFQGFGNQDTFKLIPISGGFNNESWGVVSQKVTSNNVNILSNPTGIPGQTTFNSFNPTLPIGTAAISTTTKTESAVNTDKNYSSLQKRTEETGEWFLTNYSSAYGKTTDSSKPAERYNKVLDGGTYVKIITRNQYSTTKQLYPLDGVKNDIIPLKKEVLKNAILLPSQVKEAGFNVFAGPYGIQEFSQIDLGDGVITPLTFIFYRDGRPGLAYTRAASGGKKSKYDLSSNPSNIPEINESINYDGGNYRTGVLHNEWGNNRKLFVELLTDTSKITYPFVMLMFKWIYDDNDEEPSMFPSAENRNISLFGSTLYYNQTSEYAKAMLFLHTLPFVGNGIDKNSQIDSLGFGEDWPKTISYIRHLFDVRGGFVHAPRLWCAYIGSILWRKSSEAPKMSGNQQIGGGSGTSDPIKWRKNKKNNIVENYRKPEKYEYITSLYLEDSSYSGPVKISEEDLLNTLPNQVKNEFKNVFFEFVNGTNSDFSSWTKIKSGLEIWGGNGSNFEILLNNSYNDLSEIDNLLNKDKYDIIIPQTALGERDNFRLELKGGYDNNNSVKTLIDALVEEVVIVNNNFNIWRGPYDDAYGVDGSGSFQSTKWKGNLRDGIYADKDGAFDIYFNTIINKLSDESVLSPTNEKKELEQQIFGSTNEDVIKFQLYRTCKNIHDKWLAGTTDPKNIIFQCGPNRSRVDSALASEKTGKKSSLPRLIDSFRFISRSFKDIGDMLYVNPLPVNKYLLENPNSSAYDSISQLLNDNNFDFIALPTFINFRDSKEVEAIFTPFGNYEQAMLSGTCGPSFVCAYVGQKSQHLAYANSDYPNDSFDLRCIHNENGVNLDPSIPDDFKTDSEAHEDPVGAFVVRYSQQNQNIFKDINLDQSEFSETDESLRIQDDISQKGNQNNRTIAGQNIYNVYAVRSYTAEIEMMGNAMIQPMMYFQLDNIPMFHGAYMITRVKHSIKPNHMSTNFTGVRIRYAETPLVTAMDLYMSFVDDLGLSDGNGAGGSLSNGSYAPIIVTLIENGSLNSNIVSGQIKQTKVENNIPGISFEGVSNPTLLDEAVIPLRNMLKDWAEWLDSEGFKPLKKRGSENIYAYVTSMFRENEYNSPHGWGIAVDLDFPKKDGTTFDNFNETGSKAEDFNFENNPALGWMYRHAYEYGFTQPYWANDGKKLGSKAGEEHWHWEYHGKSAICMLRKRPIPGAGNNSASDNPVNEIKESKIKSFVKNPKTSNGVEAVYNSCDYISVNASDYLNDKNKNKVRNTGCLPIVLTPTTKIDTKSIYENLKKQTKLNDFAIAGIMGNMFAESNFIPTAYNTDNGGCGAYGLVQWRGDRQTKMINYAKSGNLPTNSYIAQIGYVNKELIESFKYTYNALKTVTSTELGAKIFHQTYEAGNYGNVGFDINSVINNTLKDGKNGYIITPQVRINKAVEFYNMIQNNSFS